MTGGPSASAPGNGRRRAEVGADVIRRLGILIADHHRHEGEWALSVGSELSHAHTRHHDEILRYVRRLAHEVDGTHADPLLMSFAGKMLRNIVREHIDGDDRELTEEHGVEVQES